MARDARRRLRRLDTKQPETIVEDDNEPYDRPTAIATTASLGVLPAKFKERPIERVAIYEGTDQILRCSLYKPMAHHMWMKDNGPLFAPDMSKMDPIAAQRFTFVGNTSAYDFSIILKSARVQDSGSYRCQAIPTQFVEDDVLKRDFEVSCNLSVFPVPITTQELPPRLLSKFPSTDSDYSHRTKRGDVSDPESARKLSSANVSEYRQNSQSSRIHFIQAPQKSSMTNLPPLHRLLSSQNSSHKATNSLSLGAGTGLGIPAIGSCLILGLLVLLVLVNLYLIYSHVKRHTSRRRPVSGDTSNNT